MTTTHMLKALRASLLSTLTLAQEVTMRKQASAITSILTGTVDFARTVATTKIIAYILEARDAAIVFHNHWDKDCPHVDLDEEIEEACDAIDAEIEKLGLSKKYPHIYARLMSVGFSRPRALDVLHDAKNEVSGGWLWIRSIKDAR